MGQRGRIIGIVAAHVAFLAPAFCIGGTVRDDRSDSQYINLGSLSQYSSVGRIDGSTRNSGFLASGTLISPDWVLTAAHVVAAAKTMSFSIGGSRYLSDSWIPYPAWTGNTFAGYDIGLMHLSDPVPGIAPAVRYTGSSELNSVGTAVGFGMTGSGLTGGKTLDGNKRGEQNMIDQLMNPRLLLTDFDNPNSMASSLMGGYLPLDLEGLIAPGDSGGGLFISENAKTYLAGVNSFVGSYGGRPDSTYNDLSGHTRVSAFNQWIDEVIGTTSNMSFGLAPLDSASDTGSPVPEPGALVLLLMGGLGFFAVRFLRGK
jgi:hypothetical protein